MDFFIFNNGIMLEDGFSGSDMRVLKWSKIFLNKGNSLNIVTPQEGLLRFKELKENFNIIITTGFPMRKLGPLLGYLLRTLKTCFIVNDLFRAEVVYSSSDLMPDAIPALFLKLKNKKARWISGMHLIAPNPFRGFKKAKSKGLCFPTFKGLYYFLYQRLIMAAMRRLCDFVLVSNALDKNFLVNKGFKEKQVLVTWGGVDKDANEIEEQEVKFDACFIGRDHQQKGVDDLIEIWKMVCKKKPAARLCLLGELKRLERNIALLPIKDNFYFFGVVEGKRKYAIIKSAEIFVCPSYYESFGIVLAEAMSVGVPIVAYDLDIYRDIYPQGMLRVPVGDKNRFADTITELLDDEAKRSKLSTQAKELSLRFSWEDTAQEILERLI